MMLCSQGEAELVKWGFVVLTYLGEKRYSLQQLCGA